MLTVESFILEIEQPIKGMLEKLHSIILSCAPHIDAKLTYNIPFYYHFGRLCYLNPRNDGVDMGFCRGALLSENHLLSRTELKEVRIIQYKSFLEIKDEELQPIIFEAIILNELLKKGRK